MLINKTILPLIHFWKLHDIAGSPYDSISTFRSWHVWLFLANSSNSNAPRDDKPENRLYFSYLIADRSVRCKRYLLLAHNLGYREKLKWNFEIIYVFKHAWFEFWKIGKIGNWPNIFSIQRSPKLIFTWFQQTVLC